MESIGRLLEFSRGQLECRDLVHVQSDARKFFLMWMLGGFDSWKFESHHGSADIYYCILPVSSSVKEFFDCIADTMLGRAVDDISTGSDSEYSKWVLCFVAVTPS